MATAFGIKLVPFNFLLGCGDDGIINFPGGS
jgi:hypothetical protein